MFDGSGNVGGICLWVVFGEEDAMGGGGEGGEGEMERGGGGAIVGWTTGTRLHLGNTGAMLKFLKERGGRDVLVAREVRGD